MKKKGVSLVQYIIIIALVGLGVIFAYSLVGQQIVKQLNLYLNAFKANNIAVENNIKAISQNPGTGLITPGQWNGGEGKPPVSKCVNGVCDVDFGNYILKGIPEDFNDYTKANGSSGGNEKIYSLLAQLAKQLEENGETAEAQELKDLANLVKFNSNIQKEIETVAKKCKSQSTGDFAQDVNGCFQETIQSSWGDPLTMKYPDELTGIIAFWDNSANSGLNNTPADEYAENPRVDDLFGGTLIGQSRWFDNNGLDESLDTPTRYPANSVADAISKKYDDIVSNSKYSENLKGIIKELYLNVADINSEVLGKTDALLTRVSNGVFEHQQEAYDPLTGEVLTQKIFSVKSFDELLNIGLDGNQNLLTALKCASQNYQNAQNLCHKE